ncbi:MAG: nucleotidyltransferase family protein [Elusimicrobia bacterium]|nr:nucleotidyltransferase family protein [Elusimicrobiota bacterium]
MISLILSAGKSKRMGSDKAFLKYANKTFIETIISKLKPVSDNIIVIAGKHNIKKIREMLSEDINVILNPDYKLGQINSVKVAVKYLLKNNIKEPIMVNLIDQPYIRKETYKKIVNFYKKNKKYIIIPKAKISDSTSNNYFYKRGHPIIIPPEYFDLILKAPYDKGLHFVTHHKKAKVKDITVNDKMILKDTDTPEEIN